jgi:hypothetical protein
MHRIGGTDLFNTGWALCIKVFWSTWRGRRASFVNGSWKRIQMFSILIYQYPIFPAASKVKVKDFIKDCCIGYSGTFTLSRD